jgi:hypothetical protein
MTFGSLKLARVVEDLMLRGDHAIPDVEMPLMTFGSLKRLHDIPPCVKWGLEKRVEMPLMTFGSLKPAVGASWSR